MMQRVLIMAGGTGGHVFPALAVAEALQTQGIGIAWLGSAGGMEQPVVNNAQIPFHPISIHGVRGKGLTGLLRLPWQLIKAIWQSIKIIKAYKPDMVIGFGGYCSGPGGIAAWLMRVPLAIHEQNTRAGLTNRVLAKFASIVMQAFPNSLPSLKTITTGNPLRKKFVVLPEPNVEANNPFRILVLGGSQGATAINRAIPAALAVLKETHAIDIWHVSGRQHEEQTKKYYEALSLKARVNGFLDEIVEAYQWADCVIARSGALTLAEITAAGLPSILIPMPSSADDHQTANAVFLQNKQAAILLPQDKLTTEVLNNYLTKLIEINSKRYDMAVAAYKSCERAAAKKIIAACQQILMNQTVNK